MYVYSQSGPRARAITDRSGGAVPNHAFASLLVIDVHQLPDLVGREEQVVLDLLFGEPEIEQLAVAHHPRRVTVQAVVDEAAGARLQARDIARVDRRRIEPDRFLRGEPKRSGKREQGDERFHFQVTLCGSGRVVSIFEYHGMRKKNRKYT